MNLDIHLRIIMFDHIIVILLKHIKFDMHFQICVNRYFDQKMKFALSINFKWFIIITTLIIEEPNSIIKINHNPISHTKVRIV